MKLECMICQREGAWEVEDRGGLLIGRRPGRSAGLTVIRPVSEAIGEAWGFVCENCWASALRELRDRSTADSRDYFTVVVAAADLLERNELLTLYMGDYRYLRLEPREKEMGDGGRRKIQVGY